MEQETLDRIKDLGFVVVEAEKHGYNQISSGDIVRFKIHPDDRNLDLLNAPLKTSLILAIAEVPKKEGL